MSDTKTVKLYDPAGFDWSDVPQRGINYVTYSDYQALEKQFEERTNSMIIHRGMAIACSESAKEAYTALEKQNQDLREAGQYKEKAEFSLVEFRDSVLNERNQLEGVGLDCDQVNAVLSLFDDLLGDFLPLPPQAASEQEGAVEVNDRIHRYFGLSYASYLILPRAILQSMPDSWQRKFADALDYLDEYCEKRGVRWPEDGKSCYCQLKDKNGKIVKDDLSNYERGRRNVFEGKAD